MDVDARVERFGGLKDRPELRIVEVFAIGVGVHDETIELEPVDGAVHLLGGARGGLRGKARQAREAGRMATDHFGEPVIGNDRQVKCAVGIEHLHSGGGQRQQVHRHAVRIHFA